MVGLRVVWLNKYGLALAALYFRTGSADHICQVWRVRTSNLKSEIRGSLHYGGKSAAFGRDDGFWVGTAVLRIEGSASEEKVV
jgi:hypothetical protein